jgi:hypothetical protein
MCPDVDALSKQVLLIDKSESRPMKVVLCDLPDTAPTEEPCSITRIVHDRKSCTVHLLAFPSGLHIEIEFGGVVGLKVLDERDFSQFWRSNLDPSNEIYRGLVTRVVSGGWLQSDEIQSSHIPIGFYGEVGEYLVSGDYECVNVLCTEYPKVRVASASI